MLIIPKLIYSFLIVLIFSLIHPCWGIEKDCRENFEEILIGKTSLPIELSSKLDLPTKTEAQKLFAQKKYMEAIWLFNESGFYDLATILEKQLSAFFQTASILSVEDLDGGTTSPLLVEFEQGIMGVFKNYQNEFTAEINYEIAAYLIDRLWKTNLVPLTIERMIEGKRGSLQYFLDRPYRLTDDEARTYTVAHDIIIFDWLINNTDRHSGNFLVHSWNKKQKAIDHSITFDNRYKNRYLYRPGLSHMQEILFQYPYLYENLKLMTPLLLTENLRPLLSFQGIEELLNRRNEILEQMEQAILEEKNQ